ncbi:MAG: hypothetical protein ACRD3Q_08285 [Terriglobales bacterium]
MRRRNSFGAAAMFFVAAICSTSPCAMAQDDLTRLLDRLRANPLDEGTLIALEDRPLDAKTIPALKEAFERRDEKRDKQFIAVTLIHLGEQSNVYFEFLAQYAKQAIDDRTPSPLKYDAAGKYVKGQYSAAFENWCAQNGKDPKSVVAFQGDAANDVLLLSRAQDPRAEKLFVQGLDSAHELVVAYSVEGLGRLQVASAIPKIAQLCDNLSADAARGLGLQLAWFSDIRALQVMERVVPDERLRNFTLGTVAMQRQAEFETALRRAGRMAPAKVR